MAEDKRVSENTRRGPPRPPRVPPPTYVKTPMPQDEIKLDPPVGGPGTISRALSNVWAQLWGWTGSARRLIRCSANGELHVAGREDRALVQAGDELATAWDAFTAWQTCGDSTYRLCFRGAGSHFVELSLDGDETAEMTIYIPSNWWSPWLGVNPGTKWRAKYDAGSGIAVIYYIEHG